MKVLIELPDSVLLILRNEAKTEKRSLKSHLEYSLIQHSNRISIVNSLKNG